MTVEPVTLRAGELVLDQPTAADIPQITTYCQDPLFEKFMTLPWPDRQEHAEFFVNEFVPGGWSRGDEVTWAIRHDDTFLGVLGVRTENSMIGFWLGAEHRGNGYMPKAVATVLDWVFANSWSDRVAWEAVEGNVASREVARKAGFQYTGLRPALIIGRDGTSPLAWHAEIRSGDHRREKPGWPEAETPRAP